MSLTKSDFLKPCELLGPYSVPHLGDIYIRQVSLPEAMALHDAGEGDEAEIMVKLVIATVCDKDREPVFTDDDADALRSNAASRMQPLIEIVNEHVGLGVVDVDDIEGNSEAITPNDSGTA